MPGGELGLFGVGELGDVVELGDVGEVGDVVDDDGELDLTEFLPVLVFGVVGEVDDGFVLVGPVCVPGAMAVRGPRGTPGAVGADVDEGLFD